MDFAYSQRIMTIMKRRKRKESSLGTVIAVAFLTVYFGTILIIHIHLPTTRQEHKVAILDQQEIIKLTNMAEQIQKGEQKKVVSCRYRNNQYSQTSECPPHQTIYYFNPFEKERILCGTTIQPQSYATMPECHEHSRLFPVIPNRFNPKDLPPIVTGFLKGQPQVPFKDCDVPCIEEGNRPNILARRFVKGTNWVFTFSMEGEAYYPKLKIDPNAYKQGKFFSTTSFQSEVPLPYFSWAEYELQKPAVKYEDGIKGAVFMARNCASANHREQVVKELIDSKVFRVDSVSDCLHNAPLPPGTTRSDKGGILRKYLFYLAFENQCTDDYITEKMWGALQAGPIPVYYGAPNIHDHVPENSIINVKDFSSTKELAEYLNKVANDKELYESYHKWREGPLPEAFRNKYDFTHVHSTCRTCRWAYARLYGLGWDHKNQTLRDLSISRDLCLKEGKAIQPVTEIVGGFVASSSVSGCSVDSGPFEAVYDNKVLRRIYQSDGVVDMEFSAVGDWDGEVILNLETQVSGTVEHKTFTDAGQRVMLQDEKSRYTLLSDPPGLVNSGRARTVSVKLPFVDLPVRLRIIVEDLDELHRDAEESYFGNLMVNDFMNPMEAFVEVM